jgi:PAS domain S-box-containing protein
MKLLSFKTGERGRLRTALILFTVVSPVVLIAAVSYLKTRQGLLAYSVIGLFSIGVALTIVRVMALRRQSEEKFRTVAETATDAIVSADDHGTITYINRWGERIFGRPAGEMVGRPLTLLMPERFHEAHRKGLARFLSTGEARVIGKTVELVGRKEDGTEFPLELSLSSWTLGDRTYFTGILRDISERKRAEETLRLYAAQLESANKELEAFSYSVSHDLRAPLRGIDGFSKALLDEYSDRLDTQAQGYLQRIRAATRRMSLLIDDLLGLSRVTRAEIQRSVIDLGQLAQMIAAELKNNEPDRVVEFVIAKGIMVEGDPRLLRVAMDNLLGNAWKFTSRRAEARIEFGVEELEGKPVYYVRDNGAGFDMRYAGKLFGVFQRLHSLSEFPGTGVGLATVQRIIHRHGGRLWAEGKIGEGAVFYFTIPG